jgi:hypothetical protein
MKVKPAEGARVRDPYTLEVLPARGRRVPDTSYWRRRLRDGDVRVVPPVGDAAVVPGESEIGLTDDAGSVAFTKKKTRKKRSNNSMNGGEK